MAADRQDSHTPVGSLFVSIRSSARCRRWDQLQLLCLVTGTPACARPPSVHPVVSGLAETVPARPDRCQLTGRITMSDREGLRERVLPAVMVGRAAAKSTVRSGTEQAFYGSTGDGDHATLGRQVGAAGDLAVTGKAVGRPGLARIVPTRRGSGTAQPMRRGAVLHSRGRRHPTAGRCGRCCQWPGSCHSG